MLTVNVFCLPFAGGSKTSYYRYVDAAPESLTLIPVELPGRGGRFGEPLPGDTDAAVADILRQIRHLLDDPYAFYGHSMGALLSYLLAKRIAEEGLNQPLHLFLTGKGAPSVPGRNSPLYLLPDRELVQALRKMGGMPELILNDHKLLDLFLPVIRNDLMVTETYRYEGPAGLSMPITVVTGSEENLHPERTAAWRDESSGEVDIKVLPGGHFFIFDYAREIVDLITRTLCGYSIENEDSILR